MKYLGLIKKSVLFIGVVLMLTSCYKDRSRTTAWYYNDSKWGGFEVTPYGEQETGPGLVFIEGGTFVMGRVEQELNYNWDNIPRRVTISSFYMDPS
jgi:formylglycine-generating enzyme